MTSFQDAPDEAIEADEANEACSRLAKIKYLQSHIYW